MHKLATILCVMSVSLAAQWPNHLNPGNAQNTRKRKPDLSAPAPRCLRERQAGPVRGLAG